MQGGDGHLLIYYFSCRSPYSGRDAPTHAHHPKTFVILLRTSVQADTGGHEEKREEATCANSSHLQPVLKHTFKPTVVSV